MKVMTGLEKKLCAALRRLGITGSASVVVAVSGGADSTALLDALVHRRPNTGLAGEIFVAHLNHHLRGAEADEDEQFVRALAARLALPVFVEHIAVAEQAHAARQNLEATARRLRYDFLRRVAEERGTAYVLTAHTQDDQAETVLMALLRGSGPEGLRGIARDRPLSEAVRLLRPLLNVTRAEVLEHCRQRGLEFRTDSSNLSTDLTRNRVRHELLPLLRTFNPRAGEALARTAELLKQDEDYLQKAAAALLTASVRAEALDIPTLLNAPAALRQRTLRLWLRARRGSLCRIEAAHIAALESLLTQGQSGRVVTLPGAAQVTREFALLTFNLAPVRQNTLPSSPALTVGKAMTFGAYKLTLRRHLTRGQATAIINHLAGNSAYALLRECDQLDDLRVRARRGGDVYIPVGRHHSVKLKTLLIRHKIPRSERAVHPVLTVANEHIVWAPRLPVARAFALTADDESSFCALVTAQRSAET